MEFAKLFRAEGYCLLLVDKDAEGLKTVEQNLSLNRRGEIRILTCDLSRENSAAEVYAWVEQAGVELTVLVNNAGFGVFGCFCTTPWEREWQMLNLHIYTPSLLVKLFLPGMVKRGLGRILNVASVAAFNPGPFMCVYYSTKSYLLSFSTSVAAELAGSGVTVTCLCPGITQTRFQQSVGGPRPCVKIGMAKAEIVARCGYQAMMAGKMIAVPGFSNRFIVFVRRFLPVWFVAKQVRALQILNRRRAFEGVNQPTRLLNSPSK